MVFGGGVFACNGGSFVPFYTSMYLVFAAATMMKPGYSFLRPALVYVSLCGLAVVAVWCCFAKLVTWSHSGSRMTSYSLASSTAFCVLSSVTGSMIKHDRTVETRICDGEGSNTSATSVCILHSEPELASHYFSNTPSKPPTARNRSIHQQKPHRTKKLKPSCLWFRPLSDLPSLVIKCQTNAFSQHH